MYMTVTTTERLNDRLRLLKARARDSTRQTYYYRILSVTKVVSYSPMVLW